MKQAIKVIEEKLAELDDREFSIRQQTSAGSAVRQFGHQRYILKEVLEELENLQKENE